MYSLADLPEALPLFPLSGALLLPRARLPLNVFEPRYLAMLDDVLKSDHRLIGIVQPLDEDDEAGALQAIGCAGRLTGFQETDDGRYMISLTGICRFRIRAVEDGFAPYRRARVDWADFARDLGKAEHDPGFLRDSFFPLLTRFFAQTDLEADWDSLKEAEDEMLINALAMMLPFAAGDKQALLEAPDLAHRRKTLETLMEFALRGGTDEERLQ